MKKIILSFMIAIYTLSSCFVCFAAPQNEKAQTKASEEKEENQ